MLDEVVDGGLEFPGGAVGTATELALSEQNEPAFHMIQP